MRSDIGYCVWVLTHKICGRVQVNGRLRSQSWWQQRLESLVNTPTITVNTPWEPKAVEPYPIPFEVEIGWPDLDYDTFLKAWQKMEERHAKA